MEWITNPEIWIGLVTLTVLEIVLGIDNIIFITIMAGRLPEHQQTKGRQTGLMLALVTRVLLLLALSWMAGLTKPVFSIPAFWLLKEGHAVSGRDLILFFGGLFLLWKSTHEIHERLEGEEDSINPRGAPRFASVVVQIMLLDIVFSLDSVITAIGMARQLGVMIAAVVIAIGFMLVAAKTIGDFVHRHPTLKMLALSFLILVGFALVAESFHKEIPKGYIYFAMAFSVGVEILNIRMRRKSRIRPVELHEKYKT